MKQESFVFYRSFYEAVKEFDKDIIADLMIGLCSSALDDAMIEFANNIAKSLTNVGQFLGTAKIS